MAMPGTSPHVALFGRVPQPGTRRYGAAWPTTEITVQISAIEAAAQCFLMGCIIDWTGVLKAPQIVRAALAKIWGFQAEKSHYGLDDPGCYCGKVFEVTQAQSCLVPVPFRQTSTPHATLRRRPGFQRPGCCSSSRGVRFARSRRS